MRRRKTGGASDDELIIAFPAGSKSAFAGAWDPGALHLGTRDSTACFTARRISPSVALTKSGSAPPATARHAFEPRLEFDAAGEFGPLLGVENLQLAMIALRIERPPRHQQGAVVDMEIALDDIAAPIGGALEHGLYRPSASPFRGSAESAACSRSWRRKRKLRRTRRLSRSGLRIRAFAQYP